MKKLLKSAFSLLTSISVVAGTSFPVYAEETTEYGIIDMSNEEITVGEIESTLNFTPTAFLSNYSETSYNYGDFLDENNKAVYNAFLEIAKTPSVDELVINLPEVIKFESDSINFTMENETFYTMVFQNCVPGMDCALFDIPELFWLDEARVAISTGNVAYRYDRNKKTYDCEIDKIVLYPAYFETFTSLENVFEYQEMLNNAVENFVITGDTRYEKIKSIHDTISYFTEYDVNARFPSSCLGSLVQRGSVCESYAKGFKLMCDSIDIPCICVFGNYDSEKNTAHMWNYVQMEDGKWYGIDVTWDDNDELDGISIVYTYFLKGSENFNKKHTPEQTMNFTNFIYPEMSVSDYDPSTAVTTSETTTATTTETTTTTTTTTVATETSTTTAAEPVTTTETTVTKPDTTTEPVTTTVTETTTTEVTTTKKQPSKHTTTTTEVTTTTTSATTTVTTVPEVKYNADLNGDGKISVADLVCCANAVLKKEIPTFSCDVNGDGKTDVFDVALLRKILVQ